MVLLANAHLLLCLHVQCIVESAQRPTLSIERASQIAACKGPIAHGADAPLMPGRRQGAASAWHKWCPRLAVTYHLPQVAVGSGGSVGCPCTSLL